MNNAACATTIVAVLTLNAFGSPTAHADDLNCSPPTMQFPYPKAPMANRWDKITGGSNQEICVEVPSNKQILQTWCFIDAHVVVPGQVRPTYFQCEVNKSCLGRGTFVSTRRGPSAKPGIDLICALFQPGGDANTIGLRVKLPAPQAQPPTAAN
jgi:hypothetical protein